MKSCKKGHYYCYTEGKCKEIPSGYRVGMGGYLRKEREDEKQEIDEKFKRQYKDKKKLSQSSQRKSTGRGSSIKPGSKKTGYESKKEHRETSKKLAPYQTKGTYNAHVEENVEIQNSDGQTTAIVVDIVGPAHMKPVINSSGIWKGTQQVENKTFFNKDGLDTKLANYKLNEFIGGIPGDGYIGHPNLNIKNPLAKKQVKKKVIPNSQGGGLLNRTAAKIGDRNMEINKLLNQSFDPIDENVAVQTLRRSTGNTLKRALGAVLAAKGGEKILKDLLGTPDQPKDPDWVKNPKDEVDDELNVRSNQVKDAEKHQDFDKDMKALRRGKNLSPEEKIQRLKDAKGKRVQEQTQEPPNLSGIRDIISGVANKNMDTLIKSPSLQNLKKSAEKIVGTGKNEGAPGTLSGMAKELGPQLKTQLQKTGMDMFKDIYKKVGTQYNLNQQ
tara:strand:- start:734 stop:2056 length:1323 start_codon:yes stop_codon:yes gene_type:complete